MIIKAINPDKKHLTKIVFDEKELLIDNDVVIDSGISVGYDISEEEIAELKKNSDYKRALSRAFWYLDRMDYTEKALFEKLVRAGFSKKASAKVMARLCESGEIDFGKNAKRLIEKKLPIDASSEEKKKLLYRNGFKV